MTRTAESAFARLQKLHELLELALAQRAILVEGRHADLEANVESLNRAAQELSALDEHESRTADFDDSDLGIGAAIRDAAWRLQDVLNGNAELLESASRFVGFTLSAISNAVEEQQGRACAVAGNGCAAILLDRKV